MNAAYSRAWVALNGINRRRSVPSSGIPAHGQLRSRPVSGREPVLPPGRPRTLAPHALALGADLASLLRAQAAGADRRLELVLVLPLRLAGVGRHPDVEHVVARRDRVLAELVRVLEVDVPADERVVGAADDPERMRAARREELDP